MYGEKQIISPQNGAVQTNGIPNTPPPPFSSSDYSYPLKTKIITGIFDIIMPFITFFALFGLITYVFNEGGVGVTGCYLAFLGFTTLYIVLKQKKFPLKALFPLSLCVITAITYSLHYTDVFVITIPLLFYFSGLYCMTLTETKGSAFESYLSIYNQAKAILLIPHIKLFLPLISLWQNRKASRFKFKKGYLGIIIGIICGIPVFIIVTNLLIEGDAAFSGVMNGFTEKLADISEKLFDKLFGFIDDPFLIIITLLFTPWVVSTVFGFRHGIIKESIEKSDTENNVKVFRFVNDGILGGFYGVVALCYVIYLISQFSYLFGAFSGDIPLSVNISLSEYARRGFFEMSTVAVINLCLIGAGVIFSKRDEKGKLSKLYKGFTAFFSIFTIILIITAMSKMALYISELGLTEKRILVSLADILLALTFICILIKLFKNNFPYMKIIVYTALTLVTVYLAVSPDLMIARYNTNAYLSGRHETIDLPTITHLSDSYESIMAFNKLKDCENEVVAATAKYEIYDYYSIYYTDGRFDNNIPATLNEYRLHRFLKENEEEIKTYEKFSYYRVDYEYNIDKLMNEAKKNESLFEIKKAEITLTLNTKHDIVYIYADNDYSFFDVPDTDNLSTVTFEWKYSDNPADNFAIFEIETSYRYQTLTLKLKDGEETVNNDDVTYINGDSFHFEICDGENGELVIIEK